LNLYKNSSTIKEINEIIQNGNRTTTGKGLLVVRTDLLNVELKATSILQKLGHKIITYHNT